MPPTFDETYEPRPWRCGECRRILGVVMRDVNRVRSLYVFQRDREDQGMPTVFTLRECPRGLFKLLGLHSCDGVECSICGARTEWTPSKESYERLMSHFVKDERKHEPV